MDPSLSLRLPEKRLDPALCYPLQYEATPSNLKRLLKVDLQSDDKIAKAEVH